MLSNELIRLIFEYCSLDDSVSLSQVCSSYYDVWSSLDASLVRERVVDRAPWFSLDEEAGLDSWRKCALLVARRTAKALEDDGGIGNINKHLYTLRNLSVPVSLCSNKVEFVDAVDFSRDDSARAAMDPLFDELYLLPIDVYEGGAIQGSKLLLPYEELDFKTMAVSRSEFPGTHRLRYVYGRTTVATAPSGLKVVNCHPENKIRIVDENHSLLHVRFWTSIGELDTVVHKLSHPRDESGAYLVSSEGPNVWKTPEGSARNNPLVHLVSLVPGAGGAILVTHTTGKVPSQYLAYIEPLPSLPRVLLCDLPLGMGFRRTHHDLSSGFFTCYNGYLHVYFEGRFLRLWIDLGRRSRLDTDLQTGGEGLRGQALTVWDRTFPAIGSFSNDSELQGPRIQRNGRFVTVGDAKGLVVGDLETGTTYFNPKQVLSIPFASENRSKVIFYSVDNWVSKKIVKKISDGSSDEEDISRWWHDACIPQNVLDGEPVFTRVIHSENVTDEPHDFQDGSRDSLKESFYDDDDTEERPPLYTGMYTRRPPLVLTRATMIPTVEFCDYEDHELPLEEYQV
ncbi:hypothetical protein CJU89_1125 [Yarrowia sp. B02]|nr:hypothetical protein CJU89_1125 [Yarrowia sp. B02]